MLLSRPVKPFCSICTSHLLSLFLEGFSTISSEQWLWQTSRFHTRPSPFASRSLHGTVTRRQIVESAAPTTKQQKVDTTGRPPTETEAVARRARQAFGDTLPAGFLSSEELNIYERLYGTPIGETSSENVSPQEVADQVLQAEQGGVKNLFLKENAEGYLEEVDNEETASKDLDEVKSADAEPVAAGRREKEFRDRITVYKDTTAPSASLCEQEGASIEPNNTHIQDEDEMEDSFSSSVGYQETKDAEEPDDSIGDSTTLRAHPLTTAGRFGTSPATLQLPRERFTHPVDAMLTDLSWKHLTDVAERTFGGPGLPDSTATPSSKGHLQQKPIALEASQSKMTEMEADVYLAAIMPGAYAAVTSTLVESRRRLGSQWLEALLKAPGGPRILDAGAGGAGVLAWREILRAEWERMHPEDPLIGDQVPVGKATVITGSPELRRRASRLLIDTTFLPRLPDYVPVRDLPATVGSEVPTRKQYDVIVATHTLWTLKEDYMRKSQVQNMWALLNPAGGVLILIEKGVPRGFELVAGARAVLLKNQISSPESEEIENELQGASEARFARKERGMIIAPCTNHSQCPMYTVNGQSKGRKDYCHFSQRFIRPSYLQHILGAKDRNHEDIRFSYVAVQRGRDQRQIDRIQQGDSATSAAFAGYEHLDGTSSSLSVEDDDAIQPHMLSLPRSLMPPLKRRGHVTLDLCTPSGHLERWIVPRSFSKQAYRDARKSKWGDLWALGAKTRVLRQARVGGSKDGKKPVRVFKVDVGAHESQDRVREVSRNRGGSNKRDRKGARHRKVDEDDL
ncbi:37S ribosomal protein S22 [Lambiella insularis]|nr:37S ribosomal protein S22 [Lambiella insularis]